MLSYRPPHGYLRNHLLDILSPIPIGFGAMLRELDDGNMRRAWLKLAWCCFSSLDPDARVRVVESTREFFQEEDAVIEGLELYLPAAWAASGSQYTSSLTELVEKYLKLAWGRRPSPWEPTLISEIYSPTARLYRQKGCTETNEGIVKAWLKIAWSQRGINEDSATEEDWTAKEATTEMVKRGGDVIKNEFRELVDSAVVELEKNISCLKLMGIKDDTLKLLETKLKSTKWKRDYLEDICRRSQISH